MATLTNDHKLSVVKQHTCLLSYRSGGQKSQIRFTGQNQGIGRFKLPPETVGRNLFPCLFHLQDV